MHELSIMNDVLATALRVAKEHGGTKVTKVTLRVGVMSGIVPYFCDSMFATIAKGTIAEGCEMIVEEEPAVFKCLDCGELTTYPAPGPEYKCHVCQSGNLRLISGYKSQIVNIGIV